MDTELLFYYGSLCREAWINMYGFAPKEARACSSPSQKPMATAATAAAKMAKSSAKFIGKAPGGKAPRG